MSANAPKEQTDTGDGAAKPERHPKSMNSKLFNDILSACNQLSVQERTRLVKSLAGQLGLLTVGGQTLLHSVAETTEPKKGKTSDAKRQDVRPNPLKGTKFESEKEAAKAAMIKARDDNGGAKLPDDHQTVVSYAKALHLYKEEQNRLKPVGNLQVTTQGPKGSKRGASKSPIRETANAFVGAGAALLGRKSSRNKRTPTSDDVKMTS